MRKFKLDKLVRDKVVEGIKKSGNKPKYRVLNKHEFVRELKRKLVEESLELPITNKQKIKEELADVQEVLDNLMNVLGITRKDLKNIQRDKTKKAGSFKKRYYIKHVEAKEESEWVDYYLKSPDRFPEIK